MTDKLIEQIKADRKAGTPGEWIATKFCEVNDPDPAQSHVSFKVTPQRGVYGSVSESDARRIARVPDMEARILADAEEIRLLEESLTTSYYNGISDERVRNAKVIEAAKELADCLAKEEETAGHDVWVKLEAVADTDDALAAFNEALDSAANAAMKAATALPTPCLPRVERKAINDRGGVD